MKIYNADLGLKELIDDIQQLTSENVGKIVTFAIAHHRVKSLVGPPRATYAVDGFNISVQPCYEQLNGLDGIVTDLDISIDKYQTVVPTSAPKVDPFTRLVQSKNEKQADVDALKGSIARAEDIIKVGTPRLNHLKRELKKEKNEDRQAELEDEIATIEDEHATVEKDLTLMRSDLEEHMKLLANVTKNVESAKPAEVADPTVQVAGRYPLYFRVTI